MDYRRLKMNSQEFRFAFEKRRVAEIRLNPENQEFFVGEILDFWEFQERSGYSGRGIRAEITNIIYRRTSDSQALDYVGLENGFVCLLLEVITSFGYDSYKSGINRKQ
jgi:hypothetical protein